MSVRDVIERLLRGHEPYPAVVVDRHWGLVAANRAVGMLTAGVAAHLLEPPVHVLRLSLHPDGLAPRILNLFPADEATAHFLRAWGERA
jgi:MmyB-like transcription regulator ligand binding domain